MESLFSSWNRFLDEQEAAVIAEIDTVMSPAVRQEWKTKIDRLGAAALAASDADAGVRLHFDSQPLIRRIKQLRKSGVPVNAADWAEARRDTLAMIARYRDTDRVGGLVLVYLEQRYGQSELTPDYHADLLELAANAHPAAAKAARNASLKFEHLGKQVEIAFTAVDGRVVDFKDLRGKVVLVDFWATWCGPCIAELPNVKKVHAAYRERGFEVIGITLENGKLSPGDTAEEAAAKLARAKRVLTDFTTANDLPWPQYFDGKFWKNDIATQYKIQALPAMFLVDQNGKIVSTTARGEKLEAEVKRLLGL